MSAPRVPQHAQTAAGQWQQLSIVAQMANIGSEVERAVRAFEGGRPDRLEHALVRALELFDLSANDARWRGPRRREILRAREAFCELFFDPDVRAGSANGLRAYFLQFAVAARAART